MSESTLKLISYQVVADVINNCSLSSLWCILSLDVMRQKTQQRKKTLQLVILPRNKNAKTPMSWSARKICKVLWLFQNTCGTKGYQSMLPNCLLQTKKTSPHERLLCLWQLELLSVPCSYRKVIHVFWPIRFEDSAVLGNDSVQLCTAFYHSILIPSVFSQ